MNWGKILAFASVVVLSAFIVSGVFFIVGLTTGNWPISRDHSITLTLTGDQAYTFHSVGSIIVNPNVTLVPDKGMGPAIQYSDKQYSTDPDHPENDRGVLSGSGQTSLLISDLEKVFIPRADYVVTDGKGNSFDTYGPLVITPNDDIGNGKKFLTIRFQEKTHDPTMGHAILVVRDKVLVERR
jgi:hypothetical protein